MENVPTVAEILLMGKQPVVATIHRANVKHAVLHHVINHASPNGRVAWF